MHAHEDRDGRRGLVPNQQPDVGQPQHDRHGHRETKEDAPWVRGQPGDDHPSGARHHDPDRRQKAVIQEVKVPVALSRGKCGRAERDQQCVDGERTCQSKKQRQEHPLRFGRQPRRGADSSLDRLGFSVLGVGSLRLAVHGIARHRMIVPASLFGATSPLRRCAPRGLGLAVSALQDACRAVARDVLVRARAGERHLTGRCSPGSRLFTMGIIDPRPSDRERSARQPRAGPTNPSRTRAVRACRSGSRWPPSRRGPAHRVA